MADRSSRPHRSPNQTPMRRQRRIIKVRVLRRWGPARIAYLLGLNVSTVHNVLRRYRLARLQWLDRPTGRVIRHMNSAQDYATRSPTKASCTPPSTPIPDWSTPGSSPTDRKQNSTDFWTRANAWFLHCGFRMRNVLTDNGACYRSHNFRDSPTAPWPINGPTPGSTGPTRPAPPRPPPCSTGTYMSPAGRAARSRHRATGSRSTRRSPVAGRNHRRGWSVRTRRRWPVPR